MKKIFLSLIAAFLLSLIADCAYAMGFEEAYNSTKPMAVLLYADWAENYGTYVDNFDALEQTFGDSLNYVKLNIADKDTKTFNDRYHIYPHLPYVLMFRDGGKVSRYIPRECAIKSSCMINSLKSFVK